MFFLLPVGHDEDSVRRRPVLSIAIVAVCIGVHFLWTMPRETRLELTQLRLHEALSYYLERPYLEPGEELAPYAQRVERMLAALGQDPDKEAPRGVDVRGEQSQLDELAAEFRTTLEEGGGWPGLVPRSWSFGDLVAHMFLHAGLLHLFGNLIFLWLSGPPIEDVWGRPLFAFLYFGGGLLSGLFWVGAHAGSPTPLVGASGAIAALMGAFAVRFYRSRVRMAYIVILPPFWKRGSFLAPAWLMLGLWAGREGLSAWLADRFSLVSGVAFSVHVVGFVFGAIVALVVGILGAERRWLAPAIEKTLGGEVDPQLAEAHALLDAGNDEEAWAKLSSIVAADPGRVDASLALWDLGRRLGRAPAVVGPFLRAVREELRAGDLQLALEHWDEVQAEAPETDPDLDLRLRLVEAMVTEQREGRARELLAGLSDDAVAKLPIGLRVRVVRAAVKAEDPRSSHLAGAALAAPGLAPELRKELDEAQARSRLFASRSAAGVAAARPLPTPTPPPVATPAPAPPPAPVVAVVPAAAPPAVAGSPTSPDAVATLRVTATEAVPRRFVDGRLVVEVAGEGERRLPLDRVRAVAVARIDERPEPWLVVDLVVVPYSGRNGARTVRLRSTRYDPRVELAPGVGDLRDAFVAFVESLLSASGARPLPDDAAARGNPFAGFPSLAAYETAVLLAGDPAAPAQNST